jgi:hypothetical protein
MIIPVWLFFLMLFCTVLNPFMTILVLWMSRVARLSDTAEKFEALVQYIQNEKERLPYSVRRDFK